MIVDRILKRGTTVDLELILPGGERVHAVGEAVRVSAARKEKGYLIGVNFSRISEVSRDKIIKYVFQSNS
jgi:c-di-GMP-binding flagellar brake protein YcgR